MVLNPGLNNFTASGLATEATLDTLAVQATFSHGAKSSIGTSAVQMKASSVPANNGVMVKADIANTGIVYVGSSSSVTAGGTSDSTDGFQLNPGDGIVITVDNANDIYLIASVASQRVYWIAL